MPERRRVPVEPPRSTPTSTADTFRDVIHAASNPANNVECECPRLDPADWHEVESDWSDITFVKGAVSAVAGVPVGYTGVREGLFSQAAKLGAVAPDDAMVLLGEGRLRRPVMVEVEDVPADAKGVVRPGGVVYTRLVPAPLGAMKEAVAETRAAARARYGREPDGIWVWYLTCRVCSSPREFETLIVAHYRSGT